MVYIALGTSAVLLLAIFMNFCGSSYVKGQNEDDGFWEVYNMQWRLHLLINLSLLVILVLWLPALIAYSTLMLATMEDERFFRNDLPKLDGCMDAYSIKEALNEA